MNREEMASYLERHYPHFLPYWKSHTPLAEDSLGLLYNNEIKFGIPSKEPRPNAELLKCLVCGSYKFYGYTDSTELWCNCGHKTHLQVYQEGEVGNLYGVNFVDDFNCRKNPFKDKDQ